MYLYKKDVSRKSGLVVREPGGSSYIVFGLAPAVSSNHVQLPRRYTRLAQVARSAENPQEAFEAIWTAASMTADLLLSRSSLVR